MIIVQKLDLRFPVAEISKKLGYSRSAISNYINGVKPVSRKFMEALIKGYGLDKKILYNVDDDTLNKVLLNRLEKLRAQRDILVMDYRYSTEIEISVKLLESILREYEDRLSKTENNGNNDH